MGNRGFVSFMILFAWKWVSCRNMTFAFNLFIKSRTWLSFSGILIPFTFKEATLNAEGFGVARAGDTLCVCIVLGVIREKQMLSCYSLQIWAAEIWREAGSGINWF